MVLHRTFYVSVGHEADAPVHLRSIVPRAREFNARCGISGLLVYDGVHFAQILEGPLAALLPLLSRIASDRRHSRFTSLFTEPIASRVFEGWALGYTHRPQARQDIVRVLDSPLTNYGEALRLARQLADGIQIRTLHGRGGVAGEQQP